MAGEGGLEQDLVKYGAGCRGSEVYAGYDLDSILLAIRFMNYSMDCSLCSTIELKKGAG